MIRLIFFLASVILLFVNLAYTQAPETLWTRTYGGTDIDAGRSVQATIDGGYIITGETESFGAGGRDCYLIKTDSGGDTLWTRTYGGEDNDYGYSVSQTADGGYIIAGRTSSFGAGHFDFYLIRTDSNGDTLWTRAYGGSGFESASSILQTADGGYIVAGFTYSFGAGNSDVWLIKTNSSGDTLWSRTYGGINEDKGRSVQQTADGGYIIAGYTYGCLGGFDVYLIKTDASGDLLWTRAYGGNSNDSGHSAAQTTDGGYIIAGLTRSFGDGDYDVYLVKTDGFGYLNWTMTYGGEGNDYGYSVSQTADGGYIIAGESNSFDEGEFCSYLIKSDPGGDTIWTETYSNTTLYGCSAIQQTIDGGYIVTGHATSPSDSSLDAWLMKLDTETGIEEMNTIPYEHTLAQNYPNPFNSSTVIHYSLAYPSNVRIDIYDILGRKIETLQNSRNHSGNHQAVWKAESLCSGVYFYKLQAGDYTETRKMVLIK